MVENNSKDWVSKKIDKYVIVNKRLGKGAFGTVFRGFFEMDENRLIAAKQIPIHNLAGQDMAIKLIKREITNLEKLNSKYIVKLFDVSRTPNNLYMFLEYCMDGDLKEYLKKKKNNSLSEPEALKFFKHIVEGFKELQKHSIIHRDIKPANIMLNQGRAKISDFGFSRHLESDSQQHLTRLGSPLYMSPQILEGAKFSSKCDVWSVGIVFYEMLYGATPWTGSSQINLLDNIKAKKLTFPVDPVRSQAVKSLVSKMLQLREEDRLSWQEVFADDLVAVKDPLEESAQLLQLKDETELEKSMIENGAYIQTNLVVNYLKNVEEDLLETDTEERSAMSQARKLSRQMSSNGEEQSNMAMGGTTPKSTEDKYQFEEKAEQLVKAQIDSEKKHKSIMKVNEYVVYERNVSFFYNYVIQKIIKAFNVGSLAVPADLYYRIIFAICKCQNNNLERMSAMLKSPTSDFNQEIWRQYRESKEFTKTQKTIQTDIVYAKKLFQELVKKTHEVLESVAKKEGGPQREVLRKFQEIMVENFSSDQQVVFKQIYSANLTELLVVLKPMVLSAQAKRDLLVIARHIIVCQNPYNEFRNAEFDFSKFYEEIDNSSTESLRAELLKKLEPS